VPLDTDGCGGNNNNNSNNNNSNSNNNNNNNNNNDSNTADKLAGEDITSGLNKDLHLKAYPNPFSDQVNIEFTLAEDSKARLEIVNLEGRVISLIFDGKVNGNEPQSHQFHSGTLANGMYFYRLTTGSDIVNNKMLLFR